MPLCCSTRQNGVANSRRRLSARQPWPAALAGRQRRLPSHASPALPPPSHPIRPVTPSPPGRPLTAVLHSTSRPLPLISRRTSSTPPNVTMSVHPNQRTESVRMRRRSRAVGQAASQSALPASATTRTTDYRLHDYSLMAGATHLTAVLISIVQCRLNLYLSGLHVIVQL